MIIDVFTACLNSYMKYFFVLFMHDLHNNFFASIYICHLICSLRAIICLISQNTRERWGKEPNECEEEELEEILVTNCHLYYFLNITSNKTTIHILLHSQSLLTLRSYYETFSLISLKLTKHCLSSSRLRCSPTPRNPRSSSFTSVTLTTVSWIWSSAALKCIMSWEWWTSFTSLER